MAPITINPSQSILSPPNITDPSILHVRDTVAQIKVVANRLLQLQSRQDDLSDDEARQLSTDQKKLTILKIMLRGFNREMYLQNRSVKTATSEAKAQVDNLYLNLQNLKYEQQHLRTEIQDCRNYVYVLSYYLVILIVEHCILIWIW
jgi:THO complex subunit 5